MGLVMLSPNWPFMERACSTSPTGDHSIMSVCSCLWPPISRCWLVRSSPRRVLQGIRANEVRMSALGYDTYRYKLRRLHRGWNVRRPRWRVFASIDGFVTGGAVSTGISPGLPS